MKNALRPLTFLFFLGVALVLPIVQGCAAATVTPDPTPLEEEMEEDDEEQKKKSG